jgi:hypothetical protein
LVNLHIALMDICCPGEHPEKAGTADWQRREPPFVMVLRNRMKKWDLLVIKKGRPQKADGLS